MGTLLGTTGRHPLEILGDPSIITVIYYYYSVRVGAPFALQG